MKKKYVGGLVSVIIPTYRRTSTLSRALKSVIYQTYNNLEIIVVNDNDFDSEITIEVKKIVEKLNDNRVRLITPLYHKNGAVARNQGLYASKGEYIAFLDDDDLWFPSKIEFQIKEMMKLDESFGGISSRKIYFKKDKLTHISSNLKYKNQSKAIMRKDLNISTCTLLLKHSNLDETGYFNEELLRHQEIQLLSYFTSKYKLFIMDEVLTIINNDDAVNRPDANQLKKIKESFFKSVLDLTKLYSKKERNRIYNLHMTEIAWLFYKNGERNKGVYLLLKSLKDPLVFYSFIKRFCLKKIDKLRLKMYKNKKLVYSIIEMCSE